LLFAYLVYKDLGESWRNTDGHCRLRLYRKEAICRPFTRIKQLVGRQNCAKTPVQYCRATVLKFHVFESNHRCLLENFIGLSFCLTVGVADTNLKESERFCRIRIYTKLWIRIRIPYEFGPRHCILIVQHAL
jgi:hypothetical protein